MYAILNNEELLEPLADRLILRHLKKIQPTWPGTTEYLEKCNIQFEKTGLLSVDFAQVNVILQKDLRQWRDEIMTVYKGNYRKLVAWLSDNLDRLDLDRDYLINLCLNNTRPSFVKTIAQQLNSQPEWLLKNEPTKRDRTVLLRNIVGNEKLLQEKIQGNHRFWFIDSGYTNFLTGNKKWHRLVKNHLHHDVTGMDFPADRLAMFGRFPMPWQQQGQKILVVESSPSHYELQGTTLDAWQQQIVGVLQQHTDRPIEFKPKTGDRKTRTTVYNLLSQNPREYYCVISDSSAAAIEAVWAGVPIITLQRHVSMPVARTQCSDINDLYRGPIGNWLCALSYSQFTQNEMLNRTAYKLTRKFHGV